MAALLLGRHNERVTAIGRKTFGLWQSKLLAHHIGAEHQRHDLVVGVTPAHALAAHAAVGREHQPLGWNVLERAANVIGNLFGPLDLKRMVVDDADTNFLVGDYLAESLKIHSAGTRRFEGDHVGINLVEHLERVLIALYVLEHALLRRIAPAGGSAVPRTG